MELVIGTLILFVVVLSILTLRHNLILDDKVDGEQLLAIKKKLEELQLLVNYVETMEAGAYLAYRLARAMGYEVNEAETHANYGRDCKIRIGFRVDPGTYVTTAPEALTMEQAQAKLNELLAKKHDEECLQLSKEEEKLILNRRSKDWDSRWVEVKPKPRKAAVARKGKKK